jgi:hypothetical protein
MNPFFEVTFLVIDIFLGMMNLECSSNDEMQYFNL